ncbi:hypothetical protein PAB09_09120 [Corynebacterium sp. SCR221107]|uniref:hypothetical protein n=1 Tax=Corynebacterium sp. SCR221107 TaxID=3017361 RepID=UPI0022EC8F55|nr:hypothetical protein [Corynebacterium sp. SCR221107]WBT08060.1 hypothetical protein PAB09_09120 [Corynebacterium sp. SCR221107]
MTDHPTGAFAFRRPRLVGLAVAAAIALTGCAATTDNSAQRESTPAAVSTSSFGEVAPSLFSQPEPVDLARIVAEPDPRTIITIVEDDGGTATTEGSDEPIAALSQAKLFLAYWVLHHEPDDTDLVVDMIENSDDSIADQLDAEYPTAIDDVIEAFGLDETAYSGYWGEVTTTTNDLAKFLHLIRDDEASKPLMYAMANVAPIAADGYRQSYGTALLPGVVGTKFGWSDDLAAHSSASFANGYVIVAYTLGSADDLSEDVLGSVEITIAGSSTAAEPTLGETNTAESAISS